MQKHLDIASSILLSVTLSPPSLYIYEVAAIAINWNPLILHLCILRHT
jgi:hypothetical protein